MDETGEEEEQDPTLGKVHTQIDQDRNASTVQHTIAGSNRYRKYSWY